MNVNTIIIEIDEEISRLQQARAILSGMTTKKVVGHPKKANDVVSIEAAKPKKRKMSAAGKASIAAAQKAR